jgi:hypothetical protein
MPIGRVISNDQEVFHFIAGQHKPMSSLWPRAAYTKQSHPQ